MRKEGSVREEGRVREGGRVNIDFRILACGYAICVVTCDVMTGTVHVHYIPEIEFIRSPDRTFEMDQI